MILAIISGFITGIALGSVFYLSLILFVIICVITVIVFVYRFFVEGHNRYILNIATFILIGLLMGLVRMSFSDLYTNSHLDRYVDKKVTVEGIVVEEPDVR